MTEMDEYIKREAVKDLLERYGAAEDALTLIDSIKASDVAPVVRCKDCKHWRSDRANIHRGYCFEIVPEVWMNENDFCSYGEQRGERKE